MIVNEYLGSKSKHFFEENIHAFIYEDIFDDAFYNKLKKSVELLFKNNTLTYKTHRTRFLFEGKKQKIVSHAQNAREQQVPFDLTFEYEYHFQTKETIKSWSDNWLINNLNPIHYRYLKFFENQKPFNEEPDAWIPIRWHSNIIGYTNYLALHFDMSNYMFNTYSCHTARAKSLTFYLFDHQRDLGGEFWSESGFVYKPKQNTALCINGNYNLHGVTANNDPSSGKKNPRMAFTTRWIHKDDLYLPGHPDKCLYKLDFDD